ncbi:MAG: hemolysin [Flavobacteriales bacterium]|nr:MAG: hemolysin [Flavobacteriales bacterium]
MEPDSIVKILIALFLVLLNGFFVAAEFSIVKVRYSQIQLKAAEGNAMAKQAELIIKNLDAYLSATQLGITLASLALGWVGESALESIFHTLFSYFSFEVGETTLTTISVVCSFLIITIMHIVFGELVPKSIAIRKPESTTLFISPPLRLFYNVFRPFIWLMNAISNSFLRLVKIHPASDHEIHSTEELQLLVKQSADSGEIQEENYEIIKNALDFHDHNAKDIMVSRQNILSIDIEDSVEEIMEIIMESGHSRIPVYEDSIDNVIGIFYIKDIIREHIKRDGNLTHEVLKELMREGFFVIGTKKISDLLNDFQSKKQHIAIVIDEFGGTQGIITMEDILEELVGEIQDEEDDEDKIVEKVSDGVYWVQATQPLEEINEYLPQIIKDDEEIEYNTLAGYILHQLQEIPEENQMFDIENYHVKILKMNNKSVELVELNFDPKVEPKEDAEEE